ARTIANIIIAKFFFSILNHLIFYAFIFYFLLDVLLNIILNS
ncbi:hypothetical protein LCGC14_2634600, partial [marine sediment metagenome]